MTRNLETFRRTTTVALAVALSIVVLTVCAGCRETRPAEHRSMLMAVTNDWPVDANVAYFTENVARSDKGRCGGGWGTTLYRFARPTQTIGPIELPASVVWTACGNLFSLSVLTIGQKDDVVVHTLDYDQKINRIFRIARGVASEIRRVGSIEAGSIKALVRLDDTSFVALDQDHRLVQIDVGAFFSGESGNTEITKGSQNQGYLGAIRAGLGGYVDGKSVLLLRASDGKILPSVVGEIRGDYVTDLFGISGRVVVVSQDAPGAFAEKFFVDVFSDEAGAPGFAQVSALAVASEVNSRTYLAVRHDSGDLLLTMRGPEKIAIWCTDWLARRRSLAVDLVHGTRPRTLAFGNSGVLTRSADGDGFEFFPAVCSGR